MTIEMINIETSNGVIIGPTIGPAIAECRSEPVAAEYARASLKFPLWIAGIIVALWLAYQVLGAMLGS